VSNPAHQQDGGNGGGPPHAQLLIQALQQELIACQRLAVAGTTTAMLAHEFNNLMTPVLARAMDALQRDDVPAMRKALDRTVTQVQKAIELSRYLLRLVDPRDAADDTCAVAEAVQSALEEAVRPFHKDGIELHVDVPNTLRVRVRPLLLEQVLLNLLTNAREAMKDRRGRLAITAGAADSFVTIDVRDNGVGLTSSEIERVFRPFLAADARQDAGGWSQVGLGLHVCRLIAQQHGATVQVLANPDGAGCTFRLRWPAA